MFALDHVPPRLRTALADTAPAQSGVVSRRQLHRLGVTRWMIVANLRAQRWRLHGRQSICLHTGTLAASASRWYAVIESGPRAALDGISALEAAGLKGFQGPDSIRVSVPRVRLPSGARA